MGELEDPRELFCGEPVFFKKKGPRMAKKRLKRKDNNAWRREGSVSSK